jgi:hypothetical protein
MPKARLVVLPLPLRVLTGLLVAGSVLAQLPEDGHLDPSFGANGVMDVATSLGLPTAGDCQTIFEPYRAETNVPRPHPGYLLGCRFGVRTAVVSLTRNGRLNTAFGTQGVLLLEPSLPLTITDIDRDSATPYAYLVTGQIPLANNFARCQPKTVVIRIRQNGTIDYGYGGFGVGYRLIELGAADPVAGVACKANTLVAGNTIYVSTATGAGDGRAAVLSFNALGELNTAFSSDGIRRMDSILETAVALPRGTGVMLASTGRNTVPSDPPRLTTVALKADGTLDADYGTNGVARVNFAGALAELVGGSVDSAGNAVLFGTRTLPTERRFVVARVNPLGNLDVTFNSGGVAPGGFGYHVSTAASLGFDATSNFSVGTLDQNDRPIFAGVSRLGATATSPLRFTMLRLTNAGLPDPTARSGTELGLIWTQLAHENVGDLLGSAPISVASGRLALAGSTELLTSTVARDGIALRVALDVLFDGNFDP